MKGYGPRIQRYSGVAITLHWLIALLIIFAVGLNWAWSNEWLPDDKVRPAIDWHKSIGILVLGLAILRLLWRAGHRPPSLPTKFQRWEIGLSHLTHLLLYLVMFAMPLSGWIMDSAWKDAPTHPMHLFGGSIEWPRLGFIMNLDPATKNSIHDIFGAMHGWVAYLLYALFVMHVGGALKHQFLDREAELQRMWPGR